MGRLRVAFAGPEWHHAGGFAAPDAGLPGAGATLAAGFEPGPAGVAVALGAGLRRGSLRRLASGRRAHIGIFASGCCATVPTGDVAVHWVDATVPTGDLETVLLGSVDGVPVSADRLLVPVLAAGGPSLVLGPGRHLAIRLVRPAAWVALADGSSPETGS